MLWRETRLFAYILLAFFGSTALLFVLLEFGNYLRCARHRPGRVKTCEFCWRAMVLEMCGGSGRGAQPEAGSAGQAMSSRDGRVAAVPPRPAKRLHSNMSKTNASWWKG